MKRLSILILLVLACINTHAQSFLDKVQSEHRLKVGLVLGGGGAKGAAEVGALKIIEKSGIPIDYIAGTSIGSIVGGLYACGYRADSLEHLFLNQHWLNLFSNRKEAFKDRVLEEDEEGTTYLFGFPVLHKKKKENNNTGFGILSANAVKMRGCRPFLTRRSLARQLRARIGHAGKHGHSRSVQTSKMERVHPR